ncbi:PEP/pyruvate-binding domain-containing protein [Prevotella nigrescens]|uniref:PEP/pyruvate-binding domain-containing protein n=1 Tax=Prevotella nigrescens TaxID=28133 RepID=UPI003C736337
MNLIGVPVPPGFTITTEVCQEYYTLGRDKVVELLRGEVNDAIRNIEGLMKSKFGDTENPLLVSVRSGARASMPGMMDTILNLGLNDEVVAGIVRKTGNERFAWDSYRRFVQMYGDVVLGMKPTNKEDIDPFEEIIEKVKEENGVHLDNELSVENLKDLVSRFKAAVKAQTGKDFPFSAEEQLWGAIMAVFDSWMNERAILYRRMEGIPAEWGTAVNVQAMVFGNMGETSATGVCFSRDAGSGEDLFNGEYLINAQGEDVVAGIRTPQQITKIGSQRWAERAGIAEDVRVAQYPSMEEAMPEIYKELDTLQQKLEDHYRDMQDMEFTVQDGKLWFLQTRNGKRTGTAMVKIAMDLLKEGEIDEKTAILRCEPNKLDELLHPVFDKEALAQAKVLTRGLPASPGAATGQIVFFADDAAKWHADGHRVIMVRIETFPEITAMQTRAILGAAVQLKKEGFNPMPEIMVPLVGIVNELDNQEIIIRKTANKIFKAEGVEVPFKLGTMIEVPRAALTADLIANKAEYFSFGTNDLTQMTFGYSRDDIASFLPSYLEKKILDVDPFQVLDQEGVGQLIKIAVEKGRKTRKNLKCGICGEHGGEPTSVKFCHRVGLNYVSCSPFRVPIARLAAAQAAVEYK